MILVRPELKDLARDLDRQSALLLSQLRLIIDPDKMTQKYCRMVIDALKESTDPESQAWQDVISATAGAEQTPQRAGAQDFLTGLLNTGGAGGPDAKKTAEPNLATELGKLIANVSNPEQKIPFCDFVEMPICRLGESLCHASM